MILAELSPWVWVAVAAVSYLFVCARVAMHAARRGLRPVMWFLLAMVSAGIAPAVMFLIRGRGVSPMRPTSVPLVDPSDSPQGQDAPATQRCRQCGARFAPEEIDRTSGAAACPRCHLSLENEVPQA